MLYEESEKFEHAKAIVERLTNRGHRALFVGGWVRDVKVMGLAGDCDIDIATSARPTEIQALFPRTVGVGEQFGVMVVVIRGLPFEVATFRNDIKYSDGRHPEEISYSDSPEEDVKRRDFTCNGLFFDPFTDDVLDFVDGTGDIRRKVLKCIGNPDERFEEDFLRMLRAARFAKQLGFRVDEATALAVRRNAALIANISAERTREEIKKIIAPPGGGKGLLLLDSLGLLPAVLPEVHAMKGVEQPPEFHPEGDVFTHTVLALDSLSLDSVPLSMAALLHDSGKPSTASRGGRIRFDGHCAKSVEIARNVMTRLRFSKFEIEEAEDLIGNHMVFLDIEKMRPATLKRFLRKENILEHLALQKADCLASHGKLDHHDFAAMKLASSSEEDLKPNPLITGDDLKGLGLVPGPVFGVILASVEEAQLDGTISTREEAMDLARRIAASGG